MMKVYKQAGYPQIYVSTDRFQEINCQWMEEKKAGICEMVFSRKAVESAEKQKGIYLSFSIPILGIEYQWHPICGFDHGLKADWDRDICTMTSISAPVMAFYDSQGRNKLTFALSETKKKVRINGGVHEEDGTLLVRIEIDEKELEEVETYRLRLYLELEQYRYEETLDRVRLWWEKSCGIVPTYVPEIARAPMYSTWYSFHQKVDAKALEEEALRAKKLGFQSIIVDDGWQTDDGNRGYAYCGDWEVSENKFPDFSKHIENIHNMGMKFLLWFSVPFVGIHSRYWEKMKDKLLYFDEKRQAGVLDIRYPQIRNYLMSIYERAVKVWGVDGLKLDFIDEFYFREYKEKEEGMDFSCIQEALDYFLSEVSQKLKRIKPDIMIEFRQRYIGPNVRKYGNIFRVTDCPNSGISNRVGSVDLRLLSGSTAVHSDMIMWNREETVENAALQIINSVFATLQFSVKIATLDQEHQEMVKYWNSFMLQYMDILQRKRIHANAPQNCYPLVWSEDESTRIMAVYEPEQVIPYGADREKTILLRGTHGGLQVLRAEKESKVKIQVLNCSGKIKKEEIMVWITGYHEVEMNQADTLIVEIIE